MTLIFQIGQNSRPYLDLLDPSQVLKLNNIGWLLEKIMK